MTVEIDNYDAIVKAINRKYEHALHFGNEVLKTEHISTGSPELDIAMGGGVPRGRFTRFFGGYGATKTMTAYSVAAEAQKLDLVVAYYNIEKRFEPDFVERIGVNPKKLIVVERTSIEAIGEIMESLLGVAHLHILDSCSMAVSEDELNADVRDWRPGIAARSWGKIFRRINERWDTKDNTAILVDQVRVNFKTGGEDPAGGKIFDHQSSMSVLFKASKWLYYNDQGELSTDAKAFKGPDEQTQPQGREIKIRVEKSSVCRPFRTATLHYDLDSLKYDRVYEYAKAALHYGIVVETGRGYFTYIDDEGEVTKIHGRPKLREFIASSPELQKYIHETALEAASERELAEIE